MGSRAFFGIESLMLEPTLNDNARSRSEDSTPLASGTPGEIPHSDTHSLEPANGIAAARSPALVGLIITAAHLFIVVLLSFVCGSPRGYQALFHWDSVHYARIVDEGYHSTENLTAEHPGTCGFFPCYPLAAAGVSFLTGLAPATALILTAQICCWGFWSYFVSLCRFWNVPRAAERILAAALMLHPASFFLVAAYSESTFLMALLGFVYWSHQTGRGALALAVLHGMLMTGTRLVGLPVVLYPVFVAFSQTPWGQPNLLRDLRQRLAKPAVLAIGSSLGASAFFAFCQLQFGRWDEYFRTQQTLWRVSSQWRHFFTFGFLNEAWQPGASFADRISRASLPIALAILVLAGVVELTLLRRANTGRRVRLPLYFCTFAILLLPGASTVRLNSMVRHSLPAAAILVLLLGHLAIRYGPRRLGVIGWMALTSIIVASLGLNVHLTMRFLRGWWVA